MGGNSSRGAGAASPEKQLTTNLSKKSATAPGASESPLPQLAPSTERTHSDHKDDSRATIVYLERFGFQVDEKTSSAYQVMLKHNKKPGSYTIDLVELTNRVLDRDSGIMDFEVFVAGTIRPPDVGARIVIGQSRSGRDLETNQDDAAARVDIRNRVEKAGVLELFSKSRIGWRDEARAPLLPPDLLTAGSCGNSRRADVDVRSVSSMSTMSSGYSGINELTAPQFDVLVELSAMFTQIQGEIENQTLEYALNMHVSAEDGAIELLHPFGMFNLVAMHRMLSLWPGAVELSWVVPSHTAEPALPTVLKFTPDRSTNAPSATYSYAASVPPLPQINDVEECDGSVSDNERCAAPPAKRRRLNENGEFKGVRPADDETGVGMGTGPGAENNPPPAHMPSDTHTSSASPGATEESETFYYSTRVKRPHSEAFPEEHRGAPSDTPDPARPNAARVAGEIFSPWGGRPTNIDAFMDKIRKRDFCSQPALNTIRERYKRGDFGHPDEKIVAKFVSWGF